MLRFPVTAVSGSTGRFGKKYTLCLKSLGILAYLCFKIFSVNLSGTSSRVERFLASWRIAFDFFPSIHLCHLNKKWPARVVPA